MPMEKGARLRELQKIVGYRFRDTTILREALIHRSCVNEERDSSISDNERLEFLGDAVLQLAVSEYLITEFPHLDEGEMSKKRSALVRADSLGTAAENLKLGRYLSLGRGEEATGGRQKPSILAGALEAVLGAIFLDGGYQEASRIIRTWLERFLDAGAGERIFHSDFKSRLQELSQSRFHESPVYVLMEETGPDHDKSFQVGVRLDGHVRGFGRGHSKKEAEQNAARDALMAMEPFRADKGADWPPEGA